MHRPNSQRALETEIYFLEKMRNADAVVSWYENATHYYKRSEARGRRARAKLISALRRKAGKIKRDTRLNKTLRREHEEAGSDNDMSSSCSSNPNSW